MENELLRPREPASHRPPIHASLTLPSMSSTLFIAMRLRSHLLRLILRAYCPLPIANCRGVQSAFVQTKPRFASLITRHSSLSEAGFTLAELVIAIGLMGLVAMLVLPRLSIGTNSLGSSTRQLIGMMNALYLQASSTKRLHRLYLDLDNQSYWAMVVHPDGERPPALPGLADRITLPSDIRLMDVITPSQGKVATTRALVQFTQGGRADRSMVHLKDLNGNVLTLSLNPLTGSVQTMDSYLEPTPPDPLPDAIKIAFFPPGDSSVLRPSGGLLR